VHVDLSDDERAGLIGLLVGVIENDPFPQSPRVQLFRGIVMKLRAGSRTPSADDDAGEPETTEPTEIEEAEALSFGADFRSGAPEANVQGTGKKARPHAPPPKAWANSSIGRKRSPR
jgi:hypothetical protein